MDIGSILLGLALVAVIAFIVARPLIEHTAQPQQPLSPAERLLARREQVLTQLRDLDFDQAMSKINAEDYAAQRAQLVAEGVTILKDLDALGVSQDGALAEPADEMEAAIAQARARRAANGGAARRDLEAEIEAGVAARRTPALPHSHTPAPALTCALCSAVVLPEDRFCPKCGSPLTVACTTCGHEARVGDQFCAHCGQPLPAPAAGLTQAKAQG